MLEGVPVFYSQVEINLVSDHSSFVTSPVGISSLEGLSQFLQRPLHPSDKVKVNATDGCPTVDQGSGFSDFSVFHLVKDDRNGD